jgi:hypothetical protein
MKLTREYIPDRVGAIYTATVRGRRLTVVETEERPLAPSGAYPFGDDAAPGDIRFVGERDFADAIAQIRGADGLLVDSIDLDSSIPPAGIRDYFRAASA